MGGETLLTEAEIPFVSTMVVKTSWKIYWKHVLHPNMYKYIPFSQFERDGDTKFTQYNHHKIQHCIRKSTISNTGSFWLLVSGNFLEVVGYPQRSCCTGTETAENYFSHYLNYLSVCKLDKEETLEGWIVHASSSSWSVEFGKSLVVMQLLLQMVNLFHLLIWGLSNIHDHSGTGSKD